MEINYNVSENVLWMSFKNGDDRSFELIYRKYADALFRYGVQFTSNESLVKDAIHDVYVKLYNGVHGRRGRSQNQADPALRKRAALHRYSA